MTPQPDANKFVPMIEGRCLRFLAIVGTSTVLAACGDSTGPSHNTWAIALHLDSLEAPACTMAHPGYRCVFLEALAAVPASGVAPSSISVTTKTGTETWTGVVIEHPETTATGALQDSTFYVIAYRDSAIHSGVEGEYTNGGSTLLSVNVLYSDTSVAVALPVAGDASVSAVGAACNGPPPGLLYPLPDAEAALGTYNTGEFRIALQSTVAATPGLDSALSAIAIAPQTINGVRHMLPLYPY